MTLDPPGLVWWLLAQSYAVVFGELGMDELQALEKLIAAAGGLGVLLVLAWRLPQLVKLLLDFELEVHRQNAETVRACCDKHRTVSSATNFGVPAGQVPDNLTPAGELRPGSSPAGTGSQI